MCVGVSVGVSVSVGVGVITNTHNTTTTTTTIGLSRLSTVLSLQDKHSESYSIISRAYHLDSGNSDVMKQYNECSVVVKEEKIAMCVREKSKKISSGGSGGSDMMMSVFKNLNNLNGSGTTTTDATGSGSGSGSIDIDSFTTQLAALATLPPEQLSDYMKTNLEVSVV